MPVPPKGECILPSLGYGTSISDTIRKSLEIPLEGKIPLIFASPYIGKAMAFGLQGKLNEKFFNDTLTETNEEVVLTCDRKNMLERSRTITMFAIQNKNFVSIDQHQLVSNKPIAFRDTKVVFHATNTYDLMGKGLQILSFRETADELYNSKIIQKINNCTSANRYHLMGQLIKNGNLFFENKEFGINPSAILIKKLGLNLIKPKNSLIKNNIKL